MTVRMYKCPVCDRLLVTAADGGPMPHVCKPENEPESK
jgi:hypothetical protein